MNYQENRSTEKSEILINKVFLCIFIVCLVLSHFLHELGHYFATITQGGEFIIYYLSWEVITPLNDASIFIIEFAGPLITIFLAYLGIFLIEKTENYKLFGISFTFINSMIKIIEYIPNMLNIYKGGDEYWIAQILQINEMIVYSIFFIILFPPLIYVVFRIRRVYFQPVKSIIIILIIVCFYIGLSVLLDRLIQFNSELLIFRMINGLSLPFLILGMTSLVLFFILLSQNIKKNEAYQ